MKFKTIDQIKFEYFALVLRHYKGNRSKTAKSLGVSDRTVRTYFQNCKDLKIETEKPFRFRGVDTEFNELFYKLPSNEERLKHADGDNRFRS